LPLLFEVYKPKERLKDEDKYLTKPVAASMIKSYKARGFKIDLGISR